MSSLAGYRVAVTAARRVEDQVALLERRGAEVFWAPALSAAPERELHPSLRAETEQVVAAPADLLLATTGFGMRAWLSAAEEWRLLDRLVARLGETEIVARGPKTVGALRQRGLSESWVAPNETLAEMMAHLDGRDLTGTRVVVQEHGQSLSMLADTLRGRGAEVRTVAVYRIAAAEDPAPLRELVVRVAGRSVDAVTFTSPPAVAALMRTAEELGRLDEVATALAGDVLAVSVGHVTAAAFERWDVPTVYPERSRLAAMVTLLERELPARAGRRA